jgi:hypothetical protein
VDITVTGNMTIAAVFAQNVTLNTNVEGNGAVGRNPDQASYAPGTVVTLTATPATGWSLVQWSGDLTGSTNPASISLDSSKTITATFAQSQYNLDITVVGQGAVARAPDQPSYTYGQQVTLTPTPAQGWTFSSWGGACTGNGSCVVTMDAQKTVTVTFKAKIVVFLPLIRR